MKILLTICLAISAAFLISNKDIQPTDAILIQNDSLPPVENRPPNSNYKPAFPGQTRVRGVKTKNALQGGENCGKPGSPMGYYVIARRKVCITDKSGFMAIHSADGKQLKKSPASPKWMIAGRAVCSM